MPKILLIIFALAAGPAAEVSAATAAELFLRLPDAQCGGLSTAERQYYLDQALEAAARPGLAPGATITPDVEKPWITTYDDHYLVLQRPMYGPITFKLFDSPEGFQLLVVCRGRQLADVYDPTCGLDLCFYRAEGRNLAEGNGRDYLPPVSVLDFVTPDTLTDRRAAADLAVIGQTWNRCLTCHASGQEAAALDLVTTTNINGRACEGFLAPYDLLPLAWNGRYFTKPYDRAAVRDHEADLWRDQPASRGDGF